jgi:hypothetical protein
MLLLPVHSQVAKDPGVAAGYSRRPAIEGADSFPWRHLPSGGAAPVCNGIEWLPPLSWRLICWD